MQKKEEREREKRRKMCVEKRISSGLEVTDRSNSCPPPSDDRGRNLVPGQTVARRKSSKEKERETWRECEAATEVIWRWVEVILGKCYEAKRRVKGVSASNRVTSRESESLHWEEFTDWAVVILVTPEEETCQKWTFPHQTKWVNHSYGSINY